MKNFKTALLAGAFALASTMAFAQVTAPTSGSAGVGANVGANPSGVKAGAEVNTKAKVQTNVMGASTTTNGTAGAKTMTTGAPPSSK